VIQTERRTRKLSRKRRSCRLAGHQSTRFRPSEDPVPDEVFEPLGTCPRIRRAVSLSCSQEQVDHRTTSPLCCNYLQCFQRKLFLFSMAGLAVNMRASEPVQQLCERLTWQLGRFQKCENLCGSVSSDRKLHSDLKEAARGCCRRESAKKLNQSPWLPPRIGIHHTIKPPASRRAVLIHSTRSARLHRGRAFRHPNQLPSKVSLQFSGNGRARGIPPGCRGHPVNCGCSF